MASLDAAPPLSCVSGLRWTGVNYFCTSRQGGVSTGPNGSLNLAQHTNDNPLHVIENRRRLSSLLPVEPLWLNQVHDIRVFDADAPDNEQIVPTADAAITTQANRVLAVMTADCLPVVIADTHGMALGVAHAGWRGLAKGVLEETLRCLRAKAPKTSQWRAWIGPAISQRHFEVGPDVLAAFADQDPDTSIFFVEGIAGKKWLADLPGLARHRLQRAGVRNIELSGYCTYGEAGRFYSYRRDPATGRIATVAWLSDTNGPPLHGLP